MACFDIGKASYPTALPIADPRRGDAGTQVDPGFHDGGTLLVQVDGRTTRSPAWRTATIAYHAPMQDGGQMTAAPASPSRKLNLGCGHDIKDGWVNLDVAPLEGVDVVHDLEDLPLPFEDESFDYIECINILEHVRELPDVMRELHRILVPGGRLYIMGPHFTSYTWPTDPTHRRAFAINTFEFFTATSLHERGYYFDFAFSSVAMRAIGFQKVLFQPWNWVVEWLVNRHRKLQGLYEATFLARLFPAHVVEVELIR
jgi:SAM-dependent methyltransferase